MARTASAGAESHPAPPRLIQTIAEQRREAVALAIEGVAIQLFARRPMSEVKVEEIAETAGVAVRTLYRYFPTKEHIFAGLPRRGAEQVASLIRDRPASEAPFVAMRHAIAEVAEVEISEVERWLRAVVKSDAADRIARMSLVVSTDALSTALADRCALDKDDLWVEMASTMAAGALTVGTQQWARKGGKLVEHQLAALDIVGAGLAHTPGAGQSRRRR